MGGKTDASNRLERDPYPSRIPGTSPKLILMQWTHQGLHQCQQRPRQLLNGVMQIVADQRSVHLMRSLSLPFTTHSSMCGSASQLVLSHRPPWTLQLGTRNGPTPWSGAASLQKANCLRSSLVEG